MRDSHISLADGRTLAYSDIGQSEWPCVLFFHGAPITRLHLAYLDPVSGDWHLLDVSADEQDIPQHRMDLRLDAREGRFRGAILHRVSGEEILLAGAAFNGSELRLQMYAQPPTEQADMPWLVMTRVGARFEGHWQNAGGEAMGPKLKLVRYAARNENFVLVVDEPQNGRVPRRRNQQAHVLAREGRRHSGTGSVRDAES